MTHPEYALQLATANLLRTLALPGVTFWHTANERQCSPRQGARLKSMGQLAGVADWTIIWNPGGSNLRPRVLFIELKSAHGRLTAEQKAFQENVSEAGCIYDVCRSIDEFLACLKCHAVPLRGATVAA